MLVCTIVQCSLRTCLEFRPLLSRMQKRPLSLLKPDLELLSIEPEQHGYLGVTLETWGNAPIALA